MEYRQLGRTGVQVSKFCLGTMIYGSKVSEEDALRQVDCALDMGINFIDSANVYGRSEEFLGKALSKNGKRDRVVLATKVNVRVRRDDPNAFGNHRRHIIEQVNESLRLLQTDYIDLYYIHRPQANVPIDETLRALDDLIHQGKVLYIGCSSFPAWATVEALWASDKHRLNRFVAEQPPYHLFERVIEREILPMAETYDLAIMPWSPLANGFLTGKYKRDDIPADARLQKGNAWHDKHYTEEAFDRLDQLRELADEKGCSLAQLAIAWVTGQPHVTSTILGASTLDQLTEQFGALDVTLTDEDRARIDEIAPPGNSIIPYYYPDTHNDFRAHPHRW
jgi:aryl-alcohol dehydrogenase-like predicted oxidoreductase